MATTEKKLEIRPYNFHKVVHECNEENVCINCGGEFTRKVEHRDLYIHGSSKQYVWWSCEEYQNCATNLTIRGAFHG